ncbi:uncharacterized protein LOC128987748 [Macrosteles quadrilineatus]|uniref:uncharacterized protein LOC128987748 n=1 Tax=Macrosteles quadrilineatus TaxID=74068 RepID=UPI0023E116D9|nr:uncharacterized protein LOC128987748 [Macrosteles quadrilineatus]
MAAASAALCSVVVVVAMLVTTVAASDVMSDVIKCGGDQDASSCLKMTALRLLDTALAADSLRLTDDVTVDRRPDVTVPRHFGPQNVTSLDGVLLDRVYELITTRTVHVHEQPEDAEGRGRKKKKGGGIYLAMFGAMGVMLLKLALATLALLSGKALLIAKVALLLSAILGLKNLLAHQPQEKHAPQVIYAEPEAPHSAWSRSTQVPEAAHDIAYRGQRSLHARRS